MARNFTHIKAEKWVQTRNPEDEHGSPELPCEGDRFPKQCESDIQHNQRS